MRAHITLLAGALFLVSGPLLAEEEKRENRPSWSYLKATDLTYDMDVFGVDIEPEGYQLELSLELGDHLYGFIDRSRADDSGAVLNDFDTEGYGFGWHWDSWFASYTYDNWEIGNGEFDVDTIRLGFRDMWSERFEFNASYSWNNIEDADNDDGFQVGFAFELWDDFNLTADYETIGGDLDIDSFYVGVRFDF